MHAIVFFKTVPRAFQHTKIPKILFSGEPTDLSNSLFATMVIDCKDVPSRRPKHCQFRYYPFYVRSLSERGQNNVNQLIKSATALGGNSGIPTKTKFCAFLFSHDAQPRNQFFHMLSKYKQVDALGKAPVNYNGPRPTKRSDRGAHDPVKGTYNDGAVHAYSQYKFVIAFENSSFPGYVTEKIINPMFANAIPIYWGAPDIEKHFNVKSFICANGPGGLEAAVRQVIEIDQNPDLYKQMLREPWLNNNQLTTWLSDPSNYFTNAIRELKQAPKSQAPKLQGSSVVPQTLKLQAPKTRRPSVVPHASVPKASVSQAPKTRRPSVVPQTPKPRRPSIVPQAPKPQAPRN